jgi:hypothetical protein
MLILDLHYHTVDEALRRFIKFYNENYKKGETVEVIHGYGASGKGGLIRKNLREFLNSNSKYLKYITGEEKSSNLGLTFVIMNSRIPEIVDMLSIEILKFCSTAKTVEKISGNFRKYTQQEILKCLKRLEKSKKLKIVLKGKYKCYITS